MSVDSFETRARRVRRGLRHLPLLQPLADRVGIGLWHRHLDRIARDEGLSLPTEVWVEPTQVRRHLPAQARPVGRDADWDRLVRAWDPGRDDTTPGYTALSVAFDRHGRTVLLSGGGALADAAEPVPARVALRHPRWARTARRIMAYAHQRGGSAYQPYLHPDLAAIPSDHGEGRFAQIAEALPISCGTLVDLGANAGYFSHCFEAAGFDCIAVERSVKEADFLTAVRDAMERRFAVIKGSLTEVDLPDADVTLALSIFHHFLKSEAGHRELEAFLDRLQTRFLVFEPHLPEDPQMRGASHNPQPEEFARWVARRTGLDQVTQIGRAATGRPLFLLAATGQESP